MAEHECVKVLFELQAGREGGRAGSPGGGKSTSGGGKDSRLLEPASIAWEPLVDPDGDHRRLACRICGEQVNGSRFFAMVTHLEQEHRRFQVSRSYSLEDFVVFACALCPSMAAAALEDGEDDKDAATKSGFCPKDVHTWSSHFDETEGGVFRCAAKEKEESEKGEPTKKEEAERKVSKEEEKEETRNPRDIRTMRCRLCDHAEDGCKFMSMQVHLRTRHPAETVRSLALDSFVRFGCKKCPPAPENRDEASSSSSAPTPFEPTTLREWDNHFYKGYETCKATYRDEVGRKRKSPDKEEEEEEDAGLGDLRRLICKLCNEEVSGERFAEMGKHLKVRG